MKLISRLTAAAMILTALLALACTAMATDTGLTVDAALMEAETVSAPILVGCATLIAAILAVCSFREVDKHYH